MIGTYAALAAVSFGLGIAAKYADFMNEHGMKEPFRGAAFLSGLAWGLFGIGMIVVSPLAGLTYVAHVLYWFERVKLEYPNHALAGVLMVLGAFAFEGQFFADHAGELVAVFLGYLVTGIIQTKVRERYPATTAFWRLRLRIYLVPIVYCIYSGSIEPAIATGFGMIACEWVTHAHRYLQDVDVRTEPQPAGA